MSAIRRMIVVVFSAALAAVAGAGLTAPAASAAPPTEQRSAYWNHAVVTDIHDRAGTVENVCNAIGLVGGTAVGARSGNAAGAAVGVAGLACGSHMAELSDTIDEAYYKGCGIQTYVKLCTSTWDTKQRLEVTCPDRG